MNPIFKIVTTAAMLMLAVPAFAGGVTVAEDGDSKLQFGGKFFLDYSGIKTDTNGTTTSRTNGLNINRAYLTMKYKMDDIWSMRLTTDVGFEDKLNKKSAIFLKYAYVEGKFMPEVRLRFGIIDTPWIGYSDHLNGHRYIAKSYTDEHKFDSSADAGISLSGKIADGLVGYNVALVNGAGYTNTKSTDKQDINARVGLYPIEGLTLDVGYRYGYKGSATFNLANPTKHTLMQGMASYGNDMFRIGANYINNEQKTGAAKIEDKALESWAWAKFGGFGAYGRYELTDTTDTASAGITQTKNRYVAAVEYFTAKNVTLSLVYDFAKTNDNGFTAGDTKEVSKIGLYAQTKF